MKNKLIYSLLVITTIIFAGLWLSNLKSEKPQIEVLTSDGVVMKIQSLNRLQTVAYQIDSVIQSRKEGNWYRLWQDEQKGLFVAHGRVSAGIDLQHLTAEQVQVSADGKQVTITLPPAQIFETYLDKIEVYDVKTGLFNILDIDPELFNQAQSEAKKEVLASACKTDILNLATENAQKQVQTLFELANVQVQVQTVSPKPCG